MTAYPALEATPHGVRVKYHPTKAAADTGMFGATLKLLLKATNVKPQQMVKGLPLQQRVAVDNYPHGGAQGLVNDCQVAANEIGLAVLEPLRHLDEVAYLRFASVYKSFESADDFESEIRLMRRRDRDDY